MEKHIQQMMKMMTNWKQEVKEEVSIFKEEELDKIRGDVETWRDDLMDAKTKIHEELEELKEKEQAISQYLKKLERRIEKQERDKRRNNIMIIGFSLETHIQTEVKEVVESFIMSELGVEIAVKDGYKVGPHMCVIELEGREDKAKIMRSKGMLRGTAIYINDDLTVEERETRKIIAAKAKEYKDKGHQVKMGYQKLYVDDKCFIWNRDEEKLQEKDPK